MKKSLKKKEIDQASTNSDVDQVKDKGTNGINSVVVEVVKKDAAKKAIDELVKAKNQRLIIITMRLEKKKTQQNQK